MAEEKKSSRLHTTPPGHYVALFDGHCRFCQGQVKTLLRLARPGAIEAISFQDPGVLDKFPGLTYEECMKALQLVAPDGKVYAGFEAVANAIATRPLLKVAAMLYYVPGIRQIADAVYRLIANNRYRIMGKSLDSCEGESCRLHFGPRA